MSDGEIPKWLKGSVSKTESRFTPSASSNLAFSAKKTDYEKRDTSFHGVSFFTFDF